MQRPPGGAVLHKSWDICLIIDSAILCNICRNRARWGRSSCGQSLGSTSHSRLPEVQPHQDRSPAMLLPLTTVAGIDRPLTGAAFRSASPRFQLGSVTAPETKSNVDARGLPVCVVVAQRARTSAMLSTAPPSVHSTE